MKLAFLIALLHLLLAPAILAQNATFIAQEIAQISPCGLTCLTRTIPEVGCTLTNTTCQCASTKLVTITSKCMMANCTMDETLGLSKIQANICNRPYESQNQKIRVMTVVCAVITNTSVLLRFASRFLLGQRFGNDDWFIAAAVTSENLFTYFVENHGFGDHVWTIDLNTIPQLFKWFYICEIVYVTTMCLVKISILFFYLHVFPKKSIRIACWVTMAFCATAAVAFGLVTVFQCHPVIYVYRKDLKGGVCVNYNSVAWANAGINIVQDIMIILLPMKELHSLQLNRKKKIGACAMFGVGSIVCVASIVRLDSLRTFGLTADPTWDNIPITFWSTLETSTAILCACMPSIRAGFVKFFPKVLHVTGYTSSVTAKPTSASFESKKLASRSMEKQTTTNVISMSPLNFRPSGDGILKTASFTRIETYTEFKDESKNNQNLKLRYITASSHLELNKPLPLTPTSKASLSAKGLLAIKEEIDVEKSAAESNSNDDTIRLV